MTSFGQASLKDILAMLTACAPGFTLERKTHHFWIRYQGNIYRGLPTGEHGERNPKIQAGVIRHMIRQLGIDFECAKEHLPILT